MGLITTDVTQVPEDEVHQGARAEIFGRQQPIHQLALTAGISPNALLVPACRLVEKRHYLQMSEPHAHD
jgi:alanine racemase